MTAFLKRISGFFPAVVALALPTVFLSVDSDAYILPRAAIVIAGSCLGIGLALLIPDGPSLKNLRWPLAAAAAAALLVFAFSISHPLSLAGSYARYESLPVRLSYLGLAASAVWLMRTNLHRDALVIAFVFGTLVASAEALQQAFTHAPFRPDGNLGNANLLAALIAMAIPVAFERALRAGWLLVAWAASAVMMVGALLVTTSRSGGLGVLAGCMVVAALKIRPNRAVAAVGVAGGVLIAAAVVFLAVGPLRDLNGDPASLRLNLWRDGLHFAASRPITGWGQDTTGLAFGRFLSGDYATLVTFDRIHSGPLDLAATQGVLGLGALAWVLVVISIAAWRRRLKADVAGLAGALVGYTVWVVFNFDWAPATGAFWLLAGTLWSAAKSTDGPDEPASVEPKSRDGRDHPAFRNVLAILLAALAAALGAFPVLGDALYVRGRSDLAVQLDPLQAQYHWSLGQGLIARGNLAGGVAELQRAADLGETEPGFYVELGDREAQLGDPAAAKAAYRRALEIDPYYTPAQLRLAALRKA